VSLCKKVGSLLASTLGRYVWWRSLNRFRRLLIRWEEQARTYIAMLRLACGLITWREALKNDLPK
jgi:hypothetical protein